MIASTKIKVANLFGCLLLITLGFVSPLKAQVQIWGTSQTGSQDGIGNLFAVNNDGSDFTIKTDFLNSKDGNEPKTKLTDGLNGWYYGTTTTGGEFDGGTIYRTHAENGYEVLYNFNPATDGSNSRADLLFHSSQSLIGATSTGGENGGGAIFKYSLSDGYSVLHQLGPTSTGSNLSGSLVINVNDNLIYGTCANGGEHGFGTIISFDLESTLNIEYSFEGSDSGSYPQGGIALGVDEIMYGTTQFGGSNNQGSIWTFDANNDTHNVIYNLDGGSSDGRYPFGTLVQASDNLFLGTCSEGGNNGTGTIFSISPEGTFIKLHNFLASLEGGFPKSGLTKIDDDTFYGVTEFGGGNGFGTIYAIGLDQSFELVHDMDYTADGSNPIGTLTLVDENTVIGTASSGGANNYGSVYTYSTIEGMSNQHNFSLPLQGATPQSAQLVDNIIYGTTQSGGYYNAGVIFSSNLDGSSETLHDLHPDMDGQFPNGDILIKEDGTMFGTTRFGGFFQSGSIWTITSDGQFAAIHYFAGGSSGQFPFAGITEHSSGNLYGTTLSGGDYGHGTIFCINQNGEYETKASLFGFFDGSNPESNLVEGPNGKLYGLATMGGSFNGGSLFEYDPVSNLVTVLHNFQGGTDGGNPKGNLLMHSDGALYGTTSTGLLGSGSIYKYDFTTGFEMLHAFDSDIDGSPSEGGLIEDESGSLYGFCTYGGLFDAGTCFKYDTTNGFEVLYYFSDADGPNPLGTPALFFPECYDSADCVSTDPCSVGVCTYGVCELVDINPVFELTDIGDCQFGDDIFDAEISLTLDASPGGMINIGGQLFQLDENILSYTFTLVGLAANGAAIDLTYNFNATGCNGTTGNVGTAPSPCPPIQVTFTLHTADLDVSPDGIHIGGNFQGWSPEENPMTEVDDNLWETTITIGTGSHEFNFFNGSSLFDGEYVIGDCASNGKRLIEVGETSTSVEYCWSVCEENCTVGIADLNDRINLNIYPNIVSAGAKINVNMEGNGLANSITVVDMNGRTLQRQITYLENTELSTAGLSAGLYLIQITDANDQIIGIGRFIIK